MGEREAGLVAIGTAGLRAEIALKGAELVRLRDEAGRDLLWDGDPAFWTGRSPILFPVVGRLGGDRLTVDGTSYPMRQHGLARTATFALAERDETSCRLGLAADAATRRSFPFDFALDLAYRVADATLTVAGTVRNAGPVDMPASFGFHPAFRWPLPYGAPADSHAVTFAADEPDPLPVLRDGLLSERRRPSPVSGRTLALAPGLFDDDALVFLAPRSRSLRYGPPAGRGLRVDFADMPQLGIWSKPGAPFVCLEPWFGHASPAEFDGEFRDKPGLAVIAPGDSRTFTIAVTLEAP
jgi:galactose mutarotase-like enzyme